MPNQLTCYNAEGLIIHQQPIEDQGVDAIIELWNTGHFLKSSKLIIRDSWPEPLLVADEDGVEDYRGFREIAAGIERLKKC